jgi:hypothetical protein
MTAIKRRCPGCQPRTRENLSAVYFSAFRDGQAKGFLLEPSPPTTRWSSSLVGCFGFSVFKEAVFAVWDDFLLLDAFFIAFLIRIRLS